MTFGLSKHTPPDGSDFIEEEGRQDTFQEGKEVNK
jgi:hypothetical protein